MNQENNSLFMPPERTKKMAGGKLASTAAKNIVSFLDKKFAKEVPEKMGQAKVSMRDSMRVKEALEEELNKNPRYLDDLSDTEYNDLMSALPPKDQERFGFGEASPQSTDMYDMAFDMEPAEVAKDITMFFQNPDELLSYLQSLNPNQVRSFIANVSDEDKELFGNFDNMVKQLGPREMKAEGGEIQSEVDKYKTLYTQMEQSLAQARTDQEKKVIKQRFDEQTQNFDSSIVSKAWKQIDAERNPEDNKMKFAEGGSLFIPPEMPVDTYPNIPEDEMDDVMASQKSDAEVETDYVSYIMSEALDESEIDYINSKLEADDQLSQIFDKLILSAAEFNGAGEVEGPGDGTSDDIPARLSDGEFVFTKKATDQIGAENLQQMMDDAERAYDGGLMKKAQGGLMYNPMSAVDDPVTSNNPSAQTALDVQRQMLRANRMPSLIGG